MTGGETLFFTGGAAVADRRLLTRDVSAFPDALKPSEFEALRADRTAPEAGEAAMSENVRFCPTPAGRDLAKTAASAGLNLSADASCAVPDDGLTAAQRLAIGQLLCGSTMAACAARVGVSVRTLHRWRHQPAFAAVLNARSAEALEASCVRARNLMLKSTQLLAEALQEGDATRWAARIVQMARVWQMAQTLPAVPMDAPAEVSADVPAVS